MVRGSVGVLMESATGQRMKRRGGGGEGQGHGMGMGCVDGVGKGWGGVDKSSSACDSMCRHAQSRCWKRPAENTRRGIHQQCAEIRAVQALCLQMRRRLPRCATRAASGRIRSSIH